MIEDALAGQIDVPPLHAAAVDLFSAQSYLVDRIVPDCEHIRLPAKIVPCGHMTDVYRVICQQIGCGWTGVRGRIKPEYVNDFYRIGTLFTRYSLDPFEADPRSLEQALAASRGRSAVSDG